MFKRIWKVNLIFTFLFLLSFSLTFCIVYYGMLLKSQLRITSYTAEQSGYEYRGYYSVLWSDEIDNRLDNDLPELNQGILSYGVLVCGEDIVGVKPAYIIMEMKGNLMEPLERGDYFNEQKEYDRPQCIVGDAWLGDIKKDGELEVVRINGYDCEVSGILKPNTFEGSDERIFLYGPSMQEEFLMDLISMEESMSVDYRIPEHADRGQIKKYVDWINSRAFETAEEVPYMNEVDGGVSAAFQEVMPMYNKFFKFMLTFCFINCAFLTYVWCTKNLQQNMVKRVFGFGLPFIWLDGFKEIALYEAVSILISSIICLLIETLRGHAMNFFITWKHGVGIMAAVVLAFTFLLSMVNILYLRKLTPADTLKATE